MNANSKSPLPMLQRHFLQGCKGGSVSSKKLGWETVQKLLGQTGENGLITK